MTRDLRSRLAVEGLRLSAWSNGPFDRYGEHSHDYDKVLVAESGSIVFHLPGTNTSVELRPGDRLELPAGTAHAADVGPDGVSCLEAHLPSGSLAGMPSHVPGWGLSAAVSEGPGDRPDRGSRAGGQEAGASQS